MEKHLSQIFFYDKEKTRLGYSKLHYKFSNSSFEKNSFDRITNAMKRNSIDVGIDFQKPWEEAILDEDHYQIEYLFVGKIEDENEFIRDSEIGINIFKENTYGKKVFNSNELLRLTLVIDKACNIKKA